MCAAARIREEKDGKLLIITASHTFRIRNGEMEISPVLYQSCMHPEKIHIDPVQIRIDREKIGFQVRNQRWTIRRSEASPWKFCPGKRKSKRKAVSHVRTAEDAAGKGGEAAG